MQSIILSRSLFEFIQNGPNDILTFGYPYFTAAPISVPCLKAGAFDNTKQRNNNYFIASIPILIMGRKSKDHNRHFYRIERPLVVFFCYPNLLAAAWSIINTTSLCFWRILAGTSSVTSPSTIALIASAFSFP